jgi:hypothetical protein
MLWRKVWMVHANSAEIAIVGVRSGWIHSAFAPRPRPNTGDADAGEADGVRVIWVWAAGAKFLAWSRGFAFQDEWCEGARFGCNSNRFGDCEWNEDQ